MAKNTDPHNSDSDFEQPPIKKKRFRKKQKGQSTSSEQQSRFAIMSSMDDLESSKKTLTTANTEKSTTWAVRAFTAWVQERNATVAKDCEKCPVDLLSTKDNKLLCH